jgi:hypothetical protein
MTTWVLRMCGVLLALICFFSAWNWNDENKSFKRDGKITTVVPLRSYTQTTETKTKFGIVTGQTTRNSAEIEFISADGSHWKVNRNLSDENLAKFKAGEPVLVEYLPLHPYGARFVGETGHPLGAAMAGLVIAALTALFWGRRKAT